MPYRALPERVRPRRIVLDLDTRDEDRRVLASVRWFPTHELRDRRLAIVAVGQLVVARRIDAAVIARRRRWAATGPPIRANIVRCEQQITRLRSIDRSSRHLARRGPIDQGL